MSQDPRIGKTAQVMVRDAIVTGTVALIEDAAPGQADEDRIVEIHCPVVEHVRYGYRRRVGDVKIFE